MDKSAQKNSSTVLLNVILGTNSSCLLETLCLALGTIWKAQFTVTTEMVRSSCNQGSRSSCSGVSPDQQPRLCRAGRAQKRAGACGLGPDCPPGASIHLRATRAEMEHVPWRQAQPSDVCLVQMESSSVFVLCKSVARSLSFLSYCSSSRKHESLCDVLHFLLIITSFSLVHPLA